MPTKEKRTTPKTKLRLRAEEIARQEPISEWERMENVSPEEIHLLITADVIVRQSA